MAIPAEILNRRLRGGLPGPSSPAPPNPPTGPVQHEASGDLRFRMGDVESKVACLLLGAALGDTLEDIQQQTEDLVEEAGAASSAPNGVQPTITLRSLWEDYRDLLTVAEMDCSFTDSEVLASTRFIDGYLHRPSINEPVQLTQAQVEEVRRALDHITARMSYRENEGG